MPRAYTGAPGSPIELRRQRSFFSVVESQPLPDNSKRPATVRVADVSTMESNCRNSRTKNLAHDQLAWRQKPPLFRALVPVDEIALVRFEKKRQFLPYLKTPAEMRNNSAAFAPSLQIQFPVPSKRLPERRRFAMLLQECLASFFQGITARRARNAAKNARLRVANPLVRRRAQASRGAAAAC